MSKKGPGFLSCTNCGGSGGRDTTEIYYDKDGKAKTRKVRIVCGSCGGKGGFHV